MSIVLRDGWAQQLATGLLSESKPCEANIPSDIPNK